MVAAGSSSRGLCPAWPQAGLLTVAPREEGNIVLPEQLSVNHARIQAAPFAAAVACLLVAAPARAGGPSLARLVDFRLGLSLGWLAVGGSPQDTRTVFGLFPAEIGVGLRLTDSVALAILARAGLLHAGGGSSSPRSSTIGRRTAPSSAWRQLA